MKQNLTYVLKWMSGYSLPEQILIHSSIIFVGFKTWKLMSHPNCDIHKVKVVCPNAKWIIIIGQFIFWNK